MTPFLEQVARHYYALGGMDRLCMVFPNRRSMVFFRKYLSGAVASDPGASPMRMPCLLTINDFFCRMYGGEVTDRVRLILALYDCYSDLYPGHEPLDDFIFWGDVLISDFDDVDKYLCDPSALYANVSDYKAIQDTYSYLSENQVEALRRFVGHFRKESGRLTVSLGSSGKDFKGRFLQIWNLLLPLYKNFRKSLRDKGMAYEGMVFRDLVDKLRETPVPDVLSGVFTDVDKYVFVGLNALNGCEKAVLKRMKDAGLAEFCWDWRSDMVRDPANRSSLFMKENFRDFPQAFETDPDGLPEPEINVVPVASSTAQAKLIPHILSGRSGNWERTAIVLPDETLLVPVLNSIPPEVSDINVTMGYPMKGSSLYSLMGTVAAMQLHLRKKGGEWFFYHAQVRDIFSNSVFRSCLSDQEKEKVAEVLAAGKYYIPASDLCAGGVMEVVFKPMVTDAASADDLVIRQLAGYLRDIVEALGPRLRKAGGTILELDFAKRYHSVLNMLSGMELPVVPRTFFRLLDQLLTSISVPFRGEPLRGLQVMGPLETRSLDFDTVVILSANEGTFPRRNVSSSFIPPELRRCFGLPTYEFQDAVWAYYFYRLIQRASKVWLVCDNRTEGLKTGEESRYIKQLEYHFPVKINRFPAISEIRRPPVPSDIPKTPAHIEAIRGSSLSATSLASYLDCPARFYYRTVEKLRREDDLSGSLSAGMVGNVYHHMMQALYLGGEAMEENFPMEDRKWVEDNVKHPLEYVEASYIDFWLGRKEQMRRRIRFLITEQLKTVEVTGRNLVLEDVILRYVIKTLERDRELMGNYGTGRFKVLGLEKYLSWEYRGFRFMGFVDRMDSFREGEIRVVDYKTGKVEDNELVINDSNASAVAERLFSPENRARPKIALQLFLYDMFVGGGRDAAVLNSIYHAPGLFVSPVRSVPLNHQFSSLVRERLGDLLDEMTDPSVPFRRTDDSATCRNCDFKMICGR
ncbi:MAG: PD-(D/E)XK nuclease family protein [Bacteroidales bacterium]|nr:PD-(D/E)XK nuclease family protein [Bacteroidales bacterium]